MPLRVQMTETIRDRLTASTILDSEFYIPGNLQVPEQKSIRAIDDVHKVAHWHLRGIVLLPSGLEF